MRSVPITAWLLYAVIALPLAWLCRDELNPDGVAYLRMAGYFAGGDLDRALMAYWSPLLPLMTAGGILLGLDPLYAMRGLLVLAGASLLMASACVANRLTLDVDSAVPGRWMWLVIAAGIAPVAAGPLTPDVLMAAVLMCYAALSLHPRSFQSPAVALLTGLVAGLAYLAKAYALPFFVVHWTVLAALRHFLQTPSTSPRRIGAAWFAGVVGCAIVAGPWITALSIQAGRPIFSAAGPASHAIIGPADIDRYHPALVGLHQVPSGRLTLWEIPDAVPYAPWSPFESGAYFQHQVRYSANTLLRIAGEIASYDWFRLTLLCLIAGIAWLRRPLETNGDERRFQVVWLLLTIVVYAAPFSLIFFHERYLWYFLWPLCALSVSSLLIPLWRDVVQPWRLAIPLAVLSFAIGAAIQNRDLVSSARDTASGRSLRSALAKAGSSRVTGPIAEPGDDSTGLLLAYFTRQQYLGVAQSRDVSSLERELESAGVQTFVFRESWPITEQFLHQTRWRRRAVLADRVGPVFLYGPPSLRPGASGTPPAFAPTSLARGHDQSPAQ